MPTIALLRIDVDDKGEISAFKISDSADLRYKIEFAAAQKNLDTKSLLEYIKDREITNAHLLMPFTITFSKDRCSCLLNINDLNKYEKFEGNFTEGKTTALKPFTMIIEKDIY